MNGSELGPLFLAFGVVRPAPGEVTREVPRGGTRGSGPWGGFGADVEVQVEESGCSPKRTSRSHPRGRSSKNGVGVSRTLTLLKPESRD